MAPALTHYGDFIMDCPNCEQPFPADAEVMTDELGPYRVCAECEGSSDVDDGYDAMEADGATSFTDWMHEADLSQYDDDPSPYDGTYSEE